MSSLNKTPILIFGSTGSIGMASTNILKKNKHALILSNSNDNEDIKNLSKNEKYSVLQIIPSRKLNSNQTRQITHTSAKAARRQSRQETDKQE